MINKYIFSLMHIPGERQAMKKKVSVQVKSFFFNEYVPIFHHNSGTNGAIFTKLGAYMTYNPWRGSHIKFFKND